jgi:hypothetical protein
MVAVAAADAAAEVTAATAVAAATEAAAATKGVGGQQRERRQQQWQRSTVYVEYLCFFSNKFISYVASYVGPIQTGFLRG